MEALKGTHHLVSFFRFLALPLVPSPPSKLIMSTGPEFGNSIRKALRSILVTPSGLAALGSAGADLTKMEQSACS